MISFVFIIILISLYAMPAIASADDNEELDSKNKILVRADSMYHFQSLGSLARDPGTNGRFQSDNNDGIVDKIRSGTLRTWYAYGWDPDTGAAPAPVQYHLAGSAPSPSETPPQDVQDPVTIFVQLFQSPSLINLAHSPNSPKVSGRGGTPSTSAPMFGYFPATRGVISSHDSKAHVAQKEIKNDLLEFYESFNTTAVASLSSPVRWSTQPIQAGGKSVPSWGSELPSDYFALMNLPPAPSFYIAKFRDEKPILEVYQNVLENAVAESALEWFDSLADPTATPTAIIDFYHWLTELGPIENANGDVIPGPTLVHVLEENDITDIVDYYRDNDWPLPPEIEHEWSDYRELHEALGTDRDYVLAAYYADEISIFQVKVIYAEEGWDFPTNLVDAYWDARNDANQRVFNDWQRLQLYAYHYWDLGQEVIDFPFFQVGAAAPPQYAASGDYEYDRLLFNVNRGALCAEHFEVFYGDPDEGGFLLMDRPMGGDFGEDQRPSKWRSRYAAMANLHRRTTEGWKMGEHKTCRDAKWKPFLPYGDVLEEGERLWSGGWRPPGRKGHTLGDSLLWIPTDIIDQLNEWRETEGQKTETRQNCVIDILTNEPDIRISNWKRSLITIKPFESKHKRPLDARFDTEFVDFSTMVERDIKPALNTKETFVPGILDVQLGVYGPKRYYDYVFQFPTADKQVEASSVYNGYFAAGFERQVTSMPLVLEPLIPNLYVVDFASTSVEEYYNLISLNARTEAYPDGYITDFATNYELNTPIYESLFEPFGYTNEYQYPRMWAAGIQRGRNDTGTSNGVELPTQGGIKLLADEYKNLVFSSIYKQNYLNTNNEVLQAPHWVPMYNQVKFSFDENYQNRLQQFNPVFTSAEVRSVSIPYDPITHLASDSDISDSETRLFAEIHTKVGLQAASPSIRDIEQSEDLGYKRNNVWDIHEWFELYCIPTRVGSSRCWREFFDQRSFPEQSMMLNGPALGTCSPPIWEHDPTSDKPLPVGAQPPTVNFNRLIAACSARDSNKEEETSKQVGEEEFIDPPSILKTPDGEDWSDCDSESVMVFISALNELYTQLNEKVEANFRSYREVLDGQLAHSEPVFYRLEKRATSNRQIIQNFFLPADLIKNGFTYLDAQVHYGVEYDYMLYGYYFVVGNEYWYEDLTSPHALEHRSRKFTSGNDTISELAIQMETTEDQVIVRSYEQLEQQTDRARALNQVLSHFGLTELEYLALVNRAGDFRGPDYSNMKRFGNEYYGHPLAAGDDTEYLQFAVNNRPHLVLVESMVFSPAGAPMTTKIVDSAPPPPDVDIVPYRSVNNRALLMLNGSVGSYEANPVIINQGDAGAYRDQFLKQNPSISPGAITEANIENFQIVFDTDDHPEFFEIYRLDFAPNSYRDFTSGRKTTLDNTVKGEIVMTSNSFVDAVTPNKKYWYVFRSVDVHGNMSNPSEIFQFEMVDTGTSIYPLIEEYSFPEREAALSKPMRRYLMISPAAAQEKKHINVTDASSFVEFHQLGSRVSRDMWGKKYKLRLTSKLTGKKIDVNFTFKQGEAPETDKL